MATNRAVKVTLTLSADQYKAESEKAKKATEQLADSQDEVGKKSKEAAAASEAAAKRQADSWNMVGAGLVAAGTAVGVLGASMLKTGIEYNVLQQTTRAALTSLLGSSEAAADQMDRLDDFARNSPFSKATFIQAQQQMLAFGIETRKVVPYLDAIQNAVAASGGSNDDIAGIAATMSKIQSSAKITAEDLNELGNRGVNAAELIGSQMGMTGAEIREAISNGSLGATEALDALAAGMSEKFAGAADGVKNTFAGAFDRVKAAWRDLSSALAEPFVGSEGGGLFTSLLNETADLMRMFEGMSGPAQTATAVLIGLAGAAAFLQGSLILLGPKIDEAKAKFAEMDKGAMGSAVAWRAAGAVLAAGLLAAAPAIGESNEKLGELATAAGMAAAGFAVGGPWGAALGGGIGLLKLFGGETINVQGDVKALTATLEEQSGAVTKASAEWASNQIISSGASGAFEKVGLSVATVTDAVLGNVDAQQEVAAALDGGGKSAFEAALLYSELGGQVDQAKDAHKESAEAMRESTTASEDLEASIQTQTEAWLANAEAQMGATNAAIAQVEAQIAANEAIAGGAQIVRDASGAVDLNVESSRNAESALVDLAGANLANVQAMEEAGASSAELDAALATQRQSFIDTAVRMGYTAQEAEALADKYGLIPRTVGTDLYARDFATSVINGIAAGMAGLDGTTATVFINGVQTGAAGAVPVTRALGGSVIGPGTGTSDSIPALLSNGEHVLTAAEVRAMGGQENVYRFRRSLHAYADGGAVDYRAAARASFATSGAVTSTPTVIAQVDPAALAAGARAGVVAGFGEFGFRPGDNLRTMLEGG